MSATCSGIISTGEIKTLTISDKQVYSAVQGSGPADIMPAKRIEDARLTKKRSVMACRANYELAPASAACGSTRNALNKASLNAGISSGLRLVISLSSITTSWSTHSAPAARMSSWISG